MNELFKTDIYQQAEAIRATRDGLKSSVTKMLAGKNYKRIFFIGSGDSYLAGYAMQYAARKYQSAEVYSLLSNEAAQYWQFRAGDLLIPISISGESKSTVGTVEKALSAGASILPITGNAQSSLGKLAEQVVLIPFKSVSRRTPHSTDYQTTLMAIACIIEGLAGSEIPLLDEIADIVQGILDNLAEKSENFNVVADKKMINVIGAGPNFGTAQYGAAKFWEAGGSKSIAFETEEVGHGPFITFRNEELAVLIIIDGNSFQKGISALAGIKTLGIKTFVITNSHQPIDADSVFVIPQIDELWSPFITCIPLQYLCYTFANLQGFDVSTYSPHPDEEIGKAFKLFRGANMDDLYKK